LRKFVPIDNFEPVFTNKNFEIKEFGASDKVLIFEKNSELIDMQISFLQKEAAWAKLIYILPHTYISAQHDTNDKIIIYKNINEINNILRAHNFHFALIVGADKSILEKPLTSQVQLRLDI
jgi:ferrochelatase